MLLLGCSSGGDSNDDTIDDPVDITPPVLSLIGEATMDVVFGTPFVDPGATATDDVDGDLTANIYVSGSVDTNTLGSYTIIYTVYDAAGNDASISRQVNVIDDGNPVYLDSNGVTIRAKEWAVIGDSGEINGQTYTVVSEEDLRNRIFNGDDYLYVCTSRVTDMSSMFSNRSVNVDITRWDVRFVTNFYAMFYLSDFNQDISHWNVSNARYVMSMFMYNAEFNQDIGDWDVSNVEDMSHMFGEGSTFNQDIGNWDVSNVNSMFAMFRDNAAFNQDISEWAVQNVYDMADMFNDATSFNQDLSGWNVSNVNNCYRFSDGATNYSLPKPDFIYCTP